jgi:putative polyketide hydroxylase
MVDDAEFDCDVLVVGAGLVGLASAMFMAHQGLRVWLVERHAAISEHPRARGVHVRTMELYRAVGIADAVWAASDAELSMAFGDTLAGDWEFVRRMDPGIGGELSPTTMAACDQHTIEPILRARSAELGARMFYGCKAVQVEQDGNGVAANLVHVAPSAATHPSHVRARYLVAADGAKSPIRNGLGIGRHGQPIPGTGVSVLFEADLEPALRGRRIGGFASPASHAMMLTRGNERNRKWFAISPQPELDSLERHNLAGEVTTMIRSAVGQPDLEVAIHSAQTWTIGGYVADRYRSGRIFLVGDAAHLMPPYGGLGGTTGVADAHNLAWKLAAVCAGEAGAGLLDTYESERQTLAEYTVKEVLNLGANGLRWMMGERTDFNPVTISLGFRYGVEGATTFNPARPVEDPATPSGEPGTRAPHVPLREGRHSTLDLMDPQAFTFLAPDTSIYNSALVARPIQGVHLAALPRDHIADTASWDRIFAACAGLLVRPDGVICWRATSDPEDARRAVHDARTRALCAPPQAVA